MILIPKTHVKGSFKLYHLYLLVLTFLVWVAVDYKLYNSHSLFYTTLCEVFLDTPRSFHLYTVRQTMLFQPSSCASRGLLPICCLNVFLLPLLSLDLALLPLLSSRFLYVQCIWRIRYVSQQSLILLMCL